ncbi:MAG: hypothetical protein E7231_01170 [Cellulosilyticum sp.]|nr:hypothetical protein [Cellulosilyticum sp.]
MAGYKEISRWDATVFADYIIDKIQINILEEFDFSTVDGANYLGTKLIDISRVYSELSSLLTYIRAVKRIIGRTDNKDEYQDYIDKEKMLDDCLKALELQYKAINRNLCVRDTNSKELFLTGAMT